MVSIRKLFGLLPLCFSITKAYEHGDVINQLGDTYKWFTAGHGMLRAFSLTGIVQELEEYDIYKHGMDRDLPGQALSLAQLRDEGVFLVHHDTARQMRLEIEANHTRALGLIGQDHSVRDVGFPDLQERNICEVGVNCVKAATAFCKVKWYAATAHVANTLPSRVTWKALVKNPLVSSVAGALFGVGGTLIVTFAGRSDTGDNPPKDCDEAKGKLYKVFQEVNKVCRTAEDNAGRGKCINQCKAFLFNSLDVYDHLESYVQPKGDKCPAPTKCGGPCVN